MKRVFRSVIDVGGISQENLIHNFMRLQRAEMEFDRPEDQKIYEFITSYFQVRMEMPSLQTVRDRFPDTEMEERFKDIEAAQGYIRTNFTHLCTELSVKARKLKATALLKETNEIITKGLVFEEGREKIRKEGIQDGFRHLMARCSALLAEPGEMKHQGDIRKDGKEVLAEYEQAEADRGRAYGKFTGLNEIDTVCHGLKKGELHIHAAFTGELKSTFAINWAYNLVTRYRTNVVYFSFEMRYDHLRKLVYVLHSANKKWEVLGHKPLDYRRVRDGELTPDEKAFYYQVVEDFMSNPDYCHFEIIAPGRDYTMDDVRADAQRLHAEMDVGFIVLDHAGLMEARRGKRNQNYGVELNSILRDSKKLALQFNGGEGVPVLGLFQINRQGKAEAEKHDGKYRMDALSWANEAERSADVITTTFLDDELRAQNRTKFCNLKNRDNPLVEPFLAHVNFGARRIQSIETVHMVTPEMSYDDV